MFTVGIITASDKGANGKRIDESGKVIQYIVQQRNYEVIHYVVLPDEQAVLENELMYLCDTLQVDLVLTTGGTGFSERDITPEATKAVIEKEAVGISEAMRFYGLMKTPRAMLSRGISGIRRKTLIVNLPGSAKGVEDSLESVIDTIHHGIEILKGQSIECGKQS